MSKVIIFTNPEGENVCVMAPAPGVSIERAAADIPDGITWHVVDSSALPAEDSLFNAWRLDAAGGVTVNRERAEQLVSEARDAALKQKIRDAKLDELAFGGSKQAEIAQLMAQLNDPLAAKTVAQLDEIKRQYPGVIR